MRAIGWNFDAIPVIGDAQQSTQAESRSLIVYGVNSYPTVVPPEIVLLGNGWIRWHDIATLISTAGAGKSVFVIQAAIAWALGLLYFGIRPPRPLRILMFLGEDDGVTFGQCREGFIEHSRAITGRQLSAEDLAPLDCMIRTEYSREHVGAKFHTYLDAVLDEYPADLVIVNPLLSYIGGEIVTNISGWMRGGVMPILQQHDCAALFAHHTPKMTADGWDNTDDVYSGTGGGEIANIPRAILVLRPTAVEGLMVVKVAKRQTTGWQNESGDFVPRYFVRRSSNPERPAWIPVAHDEALSRIAASKAAGGPAGGGRKVTVTHVVEALANGPMCRQDLINCLMRTCSCSDRPAKEAIREAEEDEVISSFTAPNPRGGNPIKWLCLPCHHQVTG